MSMRYFVSMVAALLCWPVFAQSPNPYNGSWAASFDGNKTADVEGTVVVNDDGGTWKFLARDRKNPCVGREAPIAVISASADQLVFEVNRSKVLTGCKDFTMKFKKIDDRTLSGQTSEGRVISLIRQ
ncbi:MAG TPA: hypothetical protein VNU71_06405 [Burkholderiaceae bacterium]|nr:hypothetical protein [Burkholderiaceae bacterium]